MAARLRLLLAAAALALGAAPAGAAEDGFRPSGREVRAAVRATVEGQLAAFRADDPERAYGFASLGIRRQFRAPVFAEMIRRGYPMLLAHRRAEFGLVRDNRAGRARVEVTVFDARDRPTRLLYQLAEEEAGWRVEGVVALAPPRRGDT